jgi:hypothetical protein
MDSNRYNSNRIFKIFRHSFIFLLFSSFILFAQGKSDHAYGRQDTGYDLPRIAIDNYLTGAQSDNDGLKASCIYFIGKYRVLEANSQLIKEIGNTEDEDLKILIAWSIYRIGDGAGLAKLDQLAANSESQNLKSFCSNLHGIKMLENALSQGYVRLPYSKVYTD